MASETAPGVVTRVKARRAGSQALRSHPQVSGGKPEIKGHLTAQLDPLGEFKATAARQPPHCPKSAQEICEQRRRCKQRRKICEAPLTPSGSCHTPTPGVLKVTAESSEFKTHRNNTGNGG